MAHSSGGRRLEVGLLFIATAVVLEYIKVILIVAVILALAYLAFKGYRSLQRRKMLRDSEHREMGYRADAENLEAAMGFYEGSNPAYTMPMTHNGNLAYDDQPTDWLDNYDDGLVW